MSSIQQAVTLSWCLALTPSGREGHIVDRAVPYTERFSSLQNGLRIILSELGSLLWTILVKDILSFHTEVRVCSKKFIYNVLGH